ncbi:MAG: glycosyltransferase family 9 protein [Bacteriovorax sp.]|nr:glycosyltransferase family 9 protein [Bacteriovorax sp.]
MKANNNNRAPEPEKPVVTLAIVQLTRFGDLIQTAQAVEELKRNHPGYRVILIARSQFAKPLDFVLKKTFDKIYYLDTKKIFANTEINGLKTSIAGLNLFLNELSTETIEVLINLSFSKSSSYLSSLVKSVHKIGPFFDFDNKMQINDKWSQLLYATVMRGSLNPFALVDLFKNIIGIKSTDHKIAPVNMSSRSSTVVIHPFASQERKAWKAEKWVEVIYRTLKENDSYIIQIVGAKNEIIKSQMITENPLLKTFGNRIQNLTGKTTLAELSDELKKSKLFVGHDSMVGHLAALTRTPTLTVSLGSVRPQETTPYHANAYNLAPRTKCFPCFPSDACSFNQCHHDIPYQVVSSAIKQLLDKGEITAEWMKGSISSFHISSVNFYRSSFQKGHMVLESLIENHIDSPDIFRSFYKIAWSFVINDTEENLPFPKLTPNTHRELLDALTGIQHLYELSEFGKKYSHYILEEISSQTPSISKIKDYSKKIDEIDQLQGLVLKTSPSLAPIIDYFALRKANLHGDSVVKLTESSYYTFLECSSLCSILFELVENTISEHKNASGKSSPRSDANSR